MYRMALATCTAWHCISMRCGAPISVTYATSLNYFCIHFCFYFHSHFLSCCLRWLGSVCGRDGYRYYHAIFEFKYHSTRYFSHASIFHEIFHLLVSILFQIIWTIFIPNWYSLWYCFCIDIVLVIPIPSWGSCLLGLCVSNYKCVPSPSVSLLNGWPSTFWHLQLFLGAESFRACPASSLLRQTVKNGPSLGRLRCGNQPNVHFVCTPE